MAHMCGRYPRQLEGVPKSKGTFIGSSSRCILGVISAAENLPACSGKGASLGTAWQTLQKLSALCNPEEYGLGSMAHVSKHLLYSS